MKKIYLFIFLIVSANCMGQNKPEGISLQQAIDQALSQRYELKIQKLATNIAANEVNKVNAKNLPQLNADFDMRYNSQLQTNVLPGAAFGGPGAADRLIQFGTKYNTLATVAGTQNIFSPVNHGDKKIAKAQVNLQEQNQLIAETDIRQQVTESYFSALLWKEKAILSDSNLRKAHAIFTTAESQLKEGSITNYDLQKYKIDLENAKAENAKNQNNLQLAYSDLWYRMGKDTLPGAPLLQDNIKSLYQSISKELEAARETERSELKLETAQKKVYDLNIKKQNLTYFPTLYVYGNYSVQNLSNKNPVDGPRWYPFNFFGVHASIPIFDGGLKSKNKAEFQIRSESSRLNLEKLKADFTQESSSALMSVRNAETDLRYQQENLALADQLYKIDSDRLRDGMIRQNDLTTTYYTLLQTQTNYLNAVYTYLVATVRYRKAKGIL